MWLYQIVFYNVCDHFLTKKFWRKKRPKNGFQSLAMMRGQFRAQIYKSNFEDCHNLQLEHFLPQCGVSYAFKFTKVTLKLPQLTTCTFLAVRNLCKNI
jgi:hypothetical protein